MWAQYPICSGLPLEALGFIVCPSVIDPTFVQLVEWQDRYRLAVQDAATYRRMFLLLMDLYRTQTLRMERTDTRLRQVMGLETWTPEA